MDVSVIVQPFRTFRGQTYFDQKKHQQPRKSKQTARYLQEMPLARVTPRVWWRRKTASKKVPLV